MILGGLDSYSSSVQNAALVNEFKGNLFEYLVASVLARHYGVEARFIATLPDSFRQQLSFYETWMRKNSPIILKALPHLAQAAADELIKSLNRPLISVALIGKIAAGSGQDQFAEADIVLDDGHVATPLSVKLCKSHAFVNTKSAGIKTFLSKYFAPFPQAPKLQEELTQKVDFYFDWMGRKLYEMAQLEWQGKFDQEWTKQGLSELPGMLEANMSSVVGEYYAEVITFCHRALDAFFCFDQELFARCLMPLIGIGQQEMIILSCFHREEEGVAHQLDRISIESLQSFDFKQLRIGDLKEGISSFEIYFPKQILQIRVKPMNKFTTPGLKVNCSVKSVLQKEQL